MLNVERHYVGETGRAYQIDKRAVPPRAAEWITERRAEKIQPLIDVNDTVFEFGAGYGWNLLGLCCNRKVAYDISGYRCDGIEWTDQVESLPDAFADTVICHHVLEHVIHPAETLGILRRLLKPTGKLLLFVPYERGFRFYHFWPKDPEHHLFSWNAQTFGNLVDECGFAVESVCVAPANAEPAKLAVKIGLGKLGFRALSLAKRVLHRPVEVRLVARLSTEPRSTP